MQIDILNKLTSVRSRIDLIHDMTSEIGGDIEEFKEDYHDVLNSLPHELMRAIQALEDALVAADHDIGKVLSEIDDNA